MIAVKIRVASALAAKGEASGVVGALENAGAYKKRKFHEGVLDAVGYVQSGPRSTGQLATGHPTLFVILMGRSYPSTRETVRGCKSYLFLYFNKKAPLPS